MRQSRLYGTGQTPFPTPLSTSKGQQWVGQVPLSSTDQVSLMDTGTELLMGKTLGVKGEVQKRENRKSKSESLKDEYETQIIPAYLDF